MMALTVAFEGFQALRGCLVTNTGLAREEMHFRAGLWRSVIDRMFQPNVYPTKSSHAGLLANFWISRHSVDVSNINLHPVDSVPGITIFGRC